jgi:hypothetical protein
VKTESDKEEKGKRNRVKLEAEKAKSRAIEEPNVQRLAGKREKGNRKNEIEKRKGKKEDGKN